MNNNQKLLKAIYQNTEMGKETLHRMIKQCRDENFRHAMAEQFAEYHGLQDECFALMREHDMKRPSENAFSSLAYTSLYFNLRIDRTSSHMAEMVMQGSLMGIIDIARHIRESGEVDEDVRKLAEKLLATEEHNLKDMQKYL